VTAEVLGNPHQHTKEWFLARRGKLTSSKMKTIVHGGPKGWLTLIKKLQAELASDDFLGPDLEHIPAIAHGRKHEPIALANIELERGIDASLVGFVTHPIYDYIGCSSDWVEYDPATKRVKVNGEIKCPLDLKRHLAVYQTGRMPDDHRPQVQCQMFVHEVDRTLFTSYHPDAPHWKIRTVCVEVPRDETYVELMLRRCEEFRRVMFGESTVYKKVIEIPSLF
jgi:hypothetical protein